MKLTFLSALHLFFFAALRLCANLTALKRKNKSPDISCAPRTLWRKL
jgi:hypothetical protein